MRKEIEKIKETESPPKIIKNLYSAEEIKEWTDRIPLNQ